MAATPYLYRNNILPIVAELVGADRILYASDYGLLHQQRIINYVAASGLAQEAIDMILGGNAQQLLGL
jgi:predicted TIM-barrel fold metal-dependent hydrolase